MKFSALLSVGALFFITSCASEKNKTPDERKADVYYGQGTSDLVNKDYNQALINLTEAKKLNPKDAQVRNNLGMAYYFKKQFKQAEEELKEAVDINEKNSEARLNLGVLYMEKNELKNARIQFEKVLEDITFNNQYRNYYNLALLSLKEGDRQSAFDNLDKSLKEKDDYCPSHFKLGELYTEEYKFQKALKEFKESGKGTCVSLPAPIYHQGLTLLSLNKPTDAGQKFKEVMEKFPGTKFSTLANTQLKKTAEMQDQQHVSKGYQTEATKESNSVETPSF
jgi:tetratricopeptide (TPR) repeat protein